MHPLSAQQMLAVWERGSRQIPLERALALLEAACPELDSDALAAMSIGQRDSYLLRLREWTFGTEFVACSTCRNCGQQLELTLHVDHLLQNADAAPRQVPISAGGYQLLLRPLNSLDLISSRKLDAPEMARTIFSRCLISATAGDSTISADEVPDEIAHNAMDEVTQADPQADLEIVVSCEACHSTARENFDIISFFWSEIDAWARRILCEVHVLASVYGWKEADVLSLSPLRRQFYLDMVSA
jgi:hypothetical protein